MDKIRLSKNEKKVLLLLNMKETNRPKTMAEHQFIQSLQTLERKGLVKVLWVHGDEPWTYSLSPQGRVYLIDNLAFT